MSWSLFNIINFKNIKLLMWKNLFNKDINKHLNQTGVQSY
jgi:hypothetical protein